MVVSLRCFLSSVPLCGSAAESHLLFRDYEVSGAAFFYWAVFLRGICVRCKVFAYYIFYNANFLEAPAVGIINPCSEYCRVLFVA